MTPPPSPHDDENPPAPESFIAVGAATSARDARAGVHTDSSRAAADIVSLTWPVVLGQIMANAVPLIDIVMLGRLGTPTLAAVGYASQFLTLVQASLMAIGAACVAMMARAIGAGDEAEARRAFGANMWLALLVTSLLTAVTLIFPQQLLHLLAVKSEVVDLAVPYFRLTLSSALPMALALTYEHAFRAAKDTIAPMVIATLVSVLKIGCNYLLIFGAFGFPKLGLVGAGVATLVSQLVAAGLFVLAARRSAHAALQLSRTDMRSKRPAVTEAFYLALPAVGERFVMNLAMMAYFRFLGEYGVHAIAAYNVGVRILAFTWIPGLGLAVAAATLVAHALGAGDAVGAKRAGWQATSIGLWISLVLGTLFVALRVRMAMVFTDDPAVVAALDPFILVLGIALPFLVTHFTLGGALRGAGDTMTPLKAAALGNWVFRVPLGYLFAEVLRLPLFWVWGVMLVDHFARAVWLSWSFHVGDFHGRVGARLTRKLGDAAAAEAG